MKINYSHDGIFLIDLESFKDNRGEFFESFNLLKFNTLTDLNINFFQTNTSTSHKNVLRGLHFQEGCFAQSKLITVLSGSIYDVIVDLRNKRSPTFGTTYGFHLNDENRQLLFIPRGFAHGFIAKTDNTIIQYQVDNNYDKASESGLIWNDLALNIDWGVDKNDLIISDKDLILPKFDRNKIYFR